MSEVKEEKREKRKEKVPKARTPAVLPLRLDSDEFWKKRGQKAFKQVAVY